MPKERLSELIKINHLIENQARTEKLMTVCRAKNPTRPAITEAVAALKLQAQAVLE